MVISLQLSKHVLLIASYKDPASINIRDNLFSLTDFTETKETLLDYPLLYSSEINAYLISIDKELIFSDFLDRLPSKFNRLLFLSKHASKSKIPALLLHFPGNWTDDVSMGGKPRTLSYSDPILHRLLLDELLKKQAQNYIPEKYEIGIEVTHHGPTINRSCTFIEIGSTLEEWNDKSAGKIIAEAIYVALKKLQQTHDNTYSIAIGFGGPHYAPKFLQKLRENNNLAISHIAPKYIFDYIDNELVRQALEKTPTAVSSALIDWKGLKSKQRKRIIDILSELDINYERI